MDRIAVFGGLTTRYALSCTGLSLSCTNKLLESTEAQGSKLQTIKLHFCRFPIRTTAKPTHQLNGSSVWVQPFSIVLNNENCIKGLGFEVAPHVYDMYKCRWLLFIFFFEHPQPLLFNKLFVNRYD